MSQKASRTFSLRNALRKGSIPLVLIVVTVLALFAGSVIYMTGSSARLEKKAELGQQARKFAEAAMEETIVKMSNNVASADRTLKQHYAPHATRLLANRTANSQGEGTAQLPPVRIMERVIEKPANPAQAAEFYELIAAAPAFGGKNHVDKWQEVDAEGNPVTTADLSHPLFADHASAFTGMASTDVDTIRKNWMNDKSGSGGPVDGIELFQSSEFDPANLDSRAGLLDGTQFQPGSAGENYYETYTKTQYAPGSVNNDAVRTAFENLPVLKPLDWASADNTVDGPDTVHSETQVGEFLAKWDEAMNDVADHVANRIAGCGGDPNYGVGAQMAAFHLGAQAANNSQEEEEYVESCTNGGLLGYTAKLITIEATCWIKRGMMSAERNVTGHRVIQTINLAKPMDRLRKNMIPYLMYHYNLTPRELMGPVAGDATGWRLDFAKVGIFDKNDPDLNFDKVLEDNPRLNAIVTREGGKEQAKTWLHGKVISISPDAQKMLTSLSRRFPDNPSPKIWPFQLANCLKKSHE